MLQTTGAGENIVKMAEVKVKKLTPKELRILKKKQEAVKEYLR